MLINELYKQQFTISFEMFPPKTSEGIKILDSELPKLINLKPGFISVTYGAGGSTRDRTIDLSLNIKNSSDVIPLFHFTCVGFTKDEVKDYLSLIHDKGITNILALRGDPPVGEKTFKAVKGGFNYANELVEFIKKIGGFEVGVAGYPEGHIDAPDIDTDITNLKRKIDAGADYVISQLFFDNDYFYNFMDKTVKTGITAPIIPGIMPITSLKQVQRMTELCGAQIPDTLISRLQQCPSDEEMCQLGIDYTIEQCLKLKSWGVHGFHFYTLNRSSAVSKIIEAL